MEEESGLSRLNGKVKTFSLGGNSLSLLTAFACICFSGFFLDPKASFQSFVYYILKQIIGKLCTYNTWPSDDKALNFLKQITSNPIISSDNCDFPKYVSICDFLNQ